MDERFNSEGMKINRKEAAKALLKKKDYEAADDVLDFFETIGLMTHRGALDEEMVWNTLFYWFDKYWEAAQPRIQEERKKHPEAWKELEYLEGRCLAIEKVKTKGHATKDVSLEDFLTDESQL